MSTQTVPRSPEFQELITQVETALAQAAEDARELAERTGTPLVMRETKENQAGSHVKGASNTDNIQ